MQSDIDSEKHAMRRILEQREKQLVKVLDNTTGMYRSVRGIAGNAIIDIAKLGLPN